MPDERRPDPRARVPQRFLTQEMAEAVVRAAQEKARERDVTMSVAVVDESGNLVLFVRGDTCSFITFETARGKAVAAAGFRRPNREMNESYRSNPAFWAAISGPLGMAPGPGGFPLTKDGVMIGGVGCGGGIRGEDDECAEAGAKAISS